MPEAELIAVTGWLARMGRELHLVFGADSARRLAAWRGAAALLAIGPVWVAPRAGEVVDATAGVGLLDVTTPAVSGTLVRTRLAAGAPVDHLVPAEIAGRLVDRHRTLRDAAGASRSA